MKQKIFSILFFGILLSVGLGVSVHGMKAVRYGKTSMRWPKKIGQIKVAEMKVDSDRDSVTYRAEVRCDFLFGGRVYSSNKVSFGQYSSSNPKHARKILYNYPLGAYIEVYYDPMNPNISVLEPGVPLSGYMMLIIGGIFAVAGLFGVSGVLSRAEY